QAKALLWSLPLAAACRGQRPRLQELFLLRSFSLSRVLFSFLQALSFFLAAPLFLFLQAVALNRQLWRLPHQSSPPAPPGPSFRLRLLFPRRSRWKPCQSQG